MAYTQLSMKGEKDEAGPNFLVIMMLIGGVSVIIGWVIWVMLGVGVVEGFISLILALLGIALITLGIRERRLIGRLVYFIVGACFNGGLVGYCIYRFEVWSILYILIIALGDFLFLFGAVKIAFRRYKKFDGGDSQT